jgi:hypothetical protein
MPRIVRVIGAHVIAALCEDGDRCVSGEDTDGSPARWWPQVRPYDVTALYHSGAVSAGSRDAAETIAGSWGTLR